MRLSHVEVFLFLFVCASICLFERCTLIRRYFRLFEKWRCFCLFVCLFKNCVRLFEKCTVEYKVGESRYDYVFMFVYLKVHL